MVGQVANLRLGLVEPDITFFFTLANAVIMFLIMKKKLFEPVSKFIQVREDEIKAQYASAQRTEDEANELKVQYEKKISEAKAEGEQIIKEHIAKAELKSAEILSNAELQAQNYKKKADKQLADEMTKATAELKDNFAELTILAASKVVGKELDQKGHEELIASVINEVGDVEWQN